MIGHRPLRCARLLVAEGHARPTELRPDKRTHCGELLCSQLGIKICGLTSGSCEIPRVSQHVAGAHPDEDLAGDLPERQFEGGGHRIRPGEDLVSRVGRSPVGRNDVVGSGRRLIGATTPRPDQFVAADDVVDQITDRPFRTRCGRAELVRADAGKDAGERVLRALVSN